MMNRMLAVMMPFAFVGVPVVAGAQTPGTTVQAGDRVRVRASTMPAEAVGEVVDAQPDVLRIRVADKVESIDVPRSSITHLQRSLGMRRNTGKGAGVGALIGAGAGVVFVVAASGGGGCEGPCSGWALVFGAAGAGAGAILGTAIGAAQKTERWQPIPVGRAAVGIHVVPHRRGAGLALSVGF